MAKTIEELDAELVALSEDRSALKLRKREVALERRALLYEQALLMAADAVELAATDPVAAHRLAVDDSAYDVNVLLGALTVAMAPGEETGDEQEAGLLWAALEAGGYVVVTTRDGRPTVLQRNATAPEGVS